MSGVDMGTFSLDIEKFAEKAGLQAQTAMRLIVLHMFNSIVVKTPVDTGRAKGSWTVSLYTFPNSFDEGLDKSKKGKMSAEKEWEISKATSDFSGEGSIYLGSNLNYMPNLEYGPNRSKQAPQGMVRTTLTDFQNAVSSAVSKSKRIKTV
jgi:hypothetical protein